MKSDRRTKLKNIRSISKLVFLIIIPVMVFTSFNTVKSSSSSLTETSSNLLNKAAPLLSAWRFSAKNKIDLKFSNNETFKIVQFSDIQDGPNIDNRTIDLMNNILDFENPQLVVLTGDNIDDRCKTTEDIKRAIRNISEPMEARQIPWAIVFGNHDEENNILTKEDMMKLYMSYPHNISRRGPKDIDGVGNYNLLIKDSQGYRTIFNVYLLDSGAYAPDNVGGYAWIKKSQIDWYRKTSFDLRIRNNRPIHSLMFFHIPLPEFKQLWSSHKAIGNKNESEDSPEINSGLFSNLLDMGDVLGVFVGHDHTNDYIVELGGIKLGYSRNIGFGTYGKQGFSRGARVFLIKQSDTFHFRTWMRLASDFN
jgi:hypothetical protein